VLGLQLYYARYVNNFLTGEIGMEKHGLTDENEIITCQFNDLVEGEFINGIGFGYTNQDLI